MQCCTSDAKESCKLDPRVILVVHVVVSFIFFTFVAAGLYKRLHVIL